MPGSMLNIIPSASFNELPATMYGSSWIKATGSLVKKALADIYYLSQPHLESDSTGADSSS